MNRHACFSLFILTFLCICSSLAALTGQLPNGLKYIVEALPGEQGKISAHMHVSVGELDEEPGEEGYARLVKRLIFESNAISLHEGSANVEVTPEATIYKMNLNYLQRDSLTNVLKFFLSILCDQSFKDEVVQKEAIILMEEWRMQEHINRDFHQNLMDKNIFPRSFLIDNWFKGEKKETLSANAESLQKFHVKHYGPKRSTLIIAGNIDPNRVVEQIQALFSPAKDFTQPKKLIPLEQRAMIHSATIIQNDLFPFLSIAFGLIDFSGLKIVSEEDLLTGVNRLVVVELLKKMVEESLFQESTLSFGEASASSFIGNASLLRVEMRSFNSDWERLVERGVALQNSMINLAVSDSEVEAIKIKIDIDLKNKLNSINGSCDAHCQAFEQHLNRETCFKTPIEEISQMREALKSVTATSVQKAARKWMKKSKGYLVVGLPKHLKRPDLRQLTEKVNQEWGLYPPGSQPGMHLANFKETVLKKAHIRDENKKNDKDSLWAKLDERFNKDSWSISGNEHFFSHFSDYQTDPQLCKLSVEFSLGDGMERGSFQLACFAINQELRKLSTAFDHSIDTEAFSNSKILRVNFYFYKESESIVRAILEYLLLDFEIKPNQLEALKKTLAQECLSKQNDHLLQIGQACLHEALGGKSWTELQEEINETGPKQVNETIRTILGHSPLHAELVSKSINSSMAKNFFKNIFAERTSHHIRPPLDNPRLPQIAVETLEVILDRPDPQSCAMVVYQLPRTMNPINDLLRDLIVSRLKKKLVCEYCVTDCVFSTTQLGYMAFYLICHQDIANIIQEEIIAEIDKLAIKDSMTYEEFVRLSYPHQKPSWELVKFVDELEIAFQQMSQAGPALKIQVKGNQ